MRIPTFHTLISDDGTKATHEAPRMRRVCHPTLFAIVVFWMLMALEAGSQPSEGRPLAWGRNPHGQIHIPLTLSNAVSLRGGFDHAMGLSSDGHVVVWGDNSRGQLQLPSTLGPVAQIAAGYHHCLALQNDGRVVSWGDNSGGQSDVPTSATNVVQVAAGAMHSLALRSDGTAVQWGDGPGVLDFSARTNLIAVAAGAFHNVGLRKDGTVIVWGYQMSTLQQPPPGLGKVIAIAAGSVQSLALRSDGSVAVWGEWLTPKLRLPGAESNIVAIAAGHNHNLLLRSDGVVLVYGATGEAESSIPEALPRVKQIACGGYFNLAIAANGSLIRRQPSDQWFHDPEGALFQVLAEAPAPLSYQWQRDGQDLPGATQASLSLARNEALQPGVYRARVSAGGEWEFTQPVKVLAAPTLITPTQFITHRDGSTLTLDAGVGGTPPLRYSWYGNDSRGLMSPSPYGSTQRLELQNFQAQVVSNFWVVVQNEIGSVTNHVVQINRLPALPTLTLTTPAPLPYLPGETLALILKDSRGYYPTSGYVWRWNGMEIPYERILSGTIVDTYKVIANPADAGVYDFYLPNPTGTAFSNPFPIEIAPFAHRQFAGRPLTLEVSDGYGHLRSTQWHHDGVQMSGMTNRQLTFSQLSFNDAGTYSARCEYDSGQLRTVQVSNLKVLPPPAVGSVVAWGGSLSMPPSVHETANWVAFAGGAYDGMALDATGILTPWVSAPWGQSFVWPNEIAPIALRERGGRAALLDVTGRVWSQGSGDYSLGLVLITNRFMDVAVSSTHSLGLRADGRVLTWPATAPQPPTNLSAVAAVAVGKSFSLALRSNGTVVAWGDASMVARQPLISNILAIACGETHALALSSNGTVIAWGNNDRGQTQMPSGLSGVRAITAGAFHSLALLDNETVVAWGDNLSGQTNTPSDLSHVASVFASDAGSIALVREPSGVAVIEQPRDLERDFGAPASWSIRYYSESPVTLQWEKDGIPLAGETGPTLVLPAPDPSSGGDYQLTLTSATGTTITKKAHLTVDPSPYLSVPRHRGRLKVWAWADGADELRQRTVVETWGEVRHATAAKTLGEFCVWSLDGTLHFWSDGVAPPRPKTLIDTIAWEARLGSLHYGLRPNGVVNSWVGSQPYPEVPALAHGAVQLTQTSVLLKDGTVKTLGNQKLTNPPTDVQQIAETTLGIYALHRNGAVTAHGYLNTSLTPPPADLAEVTQIDVSRYHALALRKDGSVVQWATAAPALAPAPVDLGQVTQVSAADNFSLALKADGTVVAWNHFSGALQTVPPDLTNVIEISAGNVVSMAIQRGPAWVQPLRDTYAKDSEPITLRVTAEGTAPIQYAWKRNGTLIPDATGNAITFVAGTDTSGTYSVAAANGDGEIRSESVVALATPPTIRSLSDNYRARYGELHSFLVIAEGTPPLRYRWHYNGTALNVDHPSTNANLSIYADSRYTQGDYSVIVSNDYGSVTSPAIRLDVIGFVSITKNPQSQTNYLGRSTEFRVETVGDGPIAFQWLHDFVPIPGGTNSVLRLNSLSPTDQGRYSVQVSNPSTAPFTSDMASLTLLEPAPHLDPDLNNQTVGLGGTLKWTAQVSGLGPFQYHWYFNGSPLPDQTGATFLKTNADLRIQGLYQLTVENSFGSVTSSPARVTVSIPQNLVVWGSNALAKAVPLDMTNAVQVAASEHVLALRADGTVSAWGTNAAGQANVPKGLSNVIAVAAGAAHSLALKADGSVSAWGRNVEGQSTVPGNVTSIVAIATGSNVNLAIRSDGTVAAWGDSRFGQTNVPPNLTDVVGIAADATTSFALRKNGSIVAWGTNSSLPASPTSYQWIGGRSPLLARTTAGSLVELSDRRFASTVFPSGVQFADSYPVTSSTFPGTWWNTHILAMSEFGDIQMWGGVDSPQFTLSSQIANVTSVAAGLDFNAVVMAGPLIFLQPEDLILIEGQTALFSVSAESRNQTRYQWQHSGTNLLSATQPTLQIANVGAWDYGRYTVTVSDAFGKRTSRGATLTVITKAPYVSQQPKNKNVTQGSSAEFSVQVIGEEPLVFQWYRNGSLLPGATQSSLRIDNAGLIDVGLYGVTISNAYGSAESIPASLAIQPADIIVTHSNATVIGSWNIAGIQFARFLRTALYAPQSTGTNRVIFETALPLPGNYFVSSLADSFLLLKGSSATATPVLHKIHHANGTSVALPSANNSSGDRWVTLGLYPFGATGSVELVDLYPTLHDFGIAEAIRFTYYAEAIPPQELADMDVDEGSPIDLPLSFAPSPTVRVFWQKEGRYLPQQTNTVLHIDHARIADQGLYRAQITSPRVTFFSRTARVTVRVPILSVRLGIGGLEMTWKGTATLQSSTNVAGPYEPLAGAVSPMVIQPDESQRYFRLTR